MAEVTNPKHVLLVDDDPSIVQSLAAALQRSADLHGVALDLTTCHDGAEALAAARTRVPDLIISDGSMPRLDGYGLLRNVRGFAPHVPFLLVSGSDPQEKILTEHRGVFRFKPIPPNELWRLLELALFPHRTRTIVVADDEPDIREAHAKIVQDSFGDRARVLTARNAQEANHLLSSVRTDLLVTDNHLGDLIGLDVIVLARKRKDAVPAIVLTSKPHDEALRDGATIYTYDILGKPVQAAELIARCRFHLPF